MRRNFLSTAVLASALVCAAASLIAQPREPYVAGANRQDGLV
jgi:hypothetical protein